MINLDIHYTEKMSLWLDLVIMLKTLPAVMAQVIETRIKPRDGARSSAANNSNKSVVGRC
jgi:lipopolysaccharide/colanic/teichoic acid biosynthesis glycosyltransferase